MKFDQISKILSSFSVGIAGAGGLGSNCAVALARTGIGRLVIADFDIIDQGNLNRQYYFTDQIGMKKVDALKLNINRINPSTRIECHNVQLDRSNIAKVYSECDIIVEAFDRADMKEMLCETILSELPGKPLVVGSGLAGWGSNNTIRERNLGEGLVVCGDETIETSEDLPPLAPRVGIVANMQANVVVETLMKMQENED
jgi:sulfur carrier protein ThiS adenylyltransferase